MYKALNMNTDDQYIDLQISNIEQISSKKGR